MFLLYLDDVIILSNTIDDHIRHVDEIFTTLMDAGVKFKTKKCNFSQRQVEYIVHMLKPRWLETDETDLASLRNAQYSTNKTQIKSFLGLGNMYRRFIEYLWGSGMP